MPRAGLRLVEAGEEVLNEALAEQVQVNVGMGLLEACEGCGGRMTLGLSVAVLGVLEAVLRAHRQA